MNTSPDMPSSRPMTLRQQLELELLDWQGDRYRGDEDMPFDEIVRLNNISLNVTLDNLERICQEIAREAELKGLKLVMKRHADIEAEGKTSIPLLIVANRIAELTHKPQGDSRE